MSTVTERILALLDREGVPYRLVEHEPTPTSEDAARARGEPLEAGAKAIVLKVDDRFVNLVLRPTRRLDSKATRKLLGAKKVRFATPDELLELTGLVPGSVPPFGEPVLPLPLYLDDSIGTFPRAAFNAGSLTRSVVMATEDYQRIAAPTGRGAFSKEA